MKQGILSGVGYYIMVVVTKEKGPVFYSAFNPLTTIIVAILASIIIAEQMYLGRYLLICFFSSESFLFCYL